MRSEGSEREISRTVLLSIEPRWAEAILEGRKRWEYRRVPPAADPPYEALLYATAPVSAVVGQAIVDDVCYANVPTLIGKTVNETPHDYADVRAYFDDRGVGSALRMESPRRFPRAVGLEAFGVSRAPQNFQYVGGTA